MTNSKAAQWAMLVASGAADMFFQSFPVDAELAEHINKMLPGSGSITEEQIRRDRERFHELPRRGTIREAREPSPTKYVILNKAKQLDVRQAIAEILDNIFDNFERNPLEPVMLEVKIVVYGPTEASTAQIVIHENSGGIPSKRVVPLIQLGASDPDRPLGIGGIGAWGEGFKMAVFALGQEVEVFSASPGEPPIAIHFPKGWLDPNDSLWTQWKVNIHNVERNPPAEGTTLLRISALHEQVVRALGLSMLSTSQDAERSAREYAQYFGEVYAEKYHGLIEDGRDVSITLSIGSATSRVTFPEKVEMRLLENLAFLPWLRPIRWSKTWRTALEDQDRDAVLNVMIYAGVAATPERYSPRYADELSRPGIEMWGNGRLFSLKGRITDESVGWGYTYGGRGGRNPSSGPSYRRLTIVTVFTAQDSRDIPWAAPVKNDYNRRSDFYAEIRETLARVIKLFKDPQRLLDFALLPFSHVWTEYDDERKLGILFTDTGADADFVSTFADSRFGRKILSYQPTLAFKRIEPDDYENHPPTNRSLYGFEATQIQDLVTGAAATKHAPAQRVAFLKAIFPHLAMQAEIEEQLGLEDDEELG